MDKEREAFEEWCVKDDEFCIHRYDGSDEYSDDYTQCAWLAWQAAKAQAVPDGFVVVPEEPTQKMLNAGHVVMNPIKGSLVQAGTNQKRRDCYKAMIEAAQEPK